VNKRSDKTPASSYTDKEKKAIRDDLDQEDRKEIWDTIS